MFRSGVSNKMAWRKIIVGIIFRGVPVRLLAVRVPSRPREEEEEDNHPRNRPSRRSGSVGETPSAPHEDDFVFAGVFSLPSIAGRGGLGAGDGAPQGDPNFV